MYMQSIHDLPYHYIAHFPQKRQDFILQTSTIYIFTLHLT